MNDRLKEIVSFSDTKDWHLDPIGDKTILDKITKSTLSEDTLSFMSGYIKEHKISRILEFGSGLSTLLNVKTLHEDLRLTDYTYVSVDDSEKYLQITKDLVDKSYPNHCIQFVKAPITQVKLNNTSFLSYSNKAVYPIIKPSKFDLVLIDEPMGHKYGREFPLYMALPGIEEDTLILLDDSKREYEQNNLNSWRHFFGDDIQIVEKNEFQKGLTFIMLANTDCLKKNVSRSLFSKNRLRAR